ncbi:MAG TPA: actin family protein, partial [Acidobacteriaceae bacterium]|nr:actin family protein [Acidobacteriaceae bacterium]
AALTLLASGAHTGAVLSIGDTQSRAVCVQAGVELPASYRQIDLGAQHVTDYLQKIMMERNYSFTTVAEKEVVRDIEEKLCYVAPDIDAELQAAAQSSALERDYPLPDGSVVTLGNERFRAPEVLFRPSLIGAEWDGIDKQVYEAIAHLPAELRKDLYGNILVAGGSANIPGMAERMKKELTALAPSSMDIQVTVPQEPAYAAWEGGSLLASSPSAEHKWLTKEEYGETNAQIFFATREQDLRRTLAIATAGADGARLQAIPPHQVASALWFDLQGIGHVKLTNISGQPIAGPLHLVLDGVPDTMRFQSFPNSQTNAAKRPCVTVPDTTTLAPGQSAVIRFLLAKGSSQAPVTYADLTAEICTGQLD